MNDPIPAPLFGRHGSALVAIDDERTALAAVLVLQEMGRSVDVAADLDAALEWAVRANYSVIVCAGREQPETSEFVIRLRYSAPLTRVILLVDPEQEQNGLEEIGVELLPAPLNVNMLVERLWPAEAA